MATKSYNEMNADEIENQKTYLNNVAKEGGGKTIWADAELKKLNAVTPVATETTSNEKINNTSPVSTGTENYKNETFANKKYGDEKETEIGNTGKYVTTSETKANNKNATAYIPGVGDVKVTIVDGKVQETGLPVGTIITPDGSNDSWKISGATTNGYTSEKYNGTVSTNNTSNNNYNASSGGGTVPTYTTPQQQIQQAQNQVDVNALMNQLNSQWQQKYDDYVKQQQDYQNQMLANQQAEAKRQEEEIARQKAEALALQQQQVDNLVNQIGQQKTDVGQNADTGRNQAYITGLNNSKTNQNMLKNMGIANSGYSETSRINQLNNLQNAINNITTQENNAYRDIDNQINNAKANNITDMGKINLNYDQALNDAIANASNQNQSILQNMIQNAQSNYQLGYNQYTDNRDFAYNQYLNDRNFNYNAYRDSVEDDRYNQNYQHQLDREQVEDNRYNQNYQHQLDREQIEDDRYADETAYDRYVNDRNFNYNAQQDAIANALAQSKYNRDIYESDREYKLKQQELAQAQAEKAAKEYNNIVAYYASEYNKAPNKFTFLDGMYKDFNGDDETFASVTNDIADNTTKNIWYQTRFNGGYKSMDEILNLLK